MPVVRQDWVERTGLSSGRPSSSTSNTAAPARARCQKPFLPSWRSSGTPNEASFGAAVLDGRVREDGDQIAVPAGASWQLYQLNSDAYPDL